MNRLLVALLAAVDALIAAAVGLVVALAPLTVLWVVGFGGTADWGALWPAAVRVWELGHLVPVQVVLGDAYLVAAGIPVEASRFTLSLAPLAFALFTALFAARSGGRAARAGEWIAGVLAGTVVFAAAALGAAVTSSNPVAHVELWQAVLLPTAVFAVPALVGGLVGAWREGDGGLVDRMRARLGSAARAAVAASARGLGVAGTGLVGAGALLVAVALVLRGAEVIALFQAANVDAVGATVLALGQLAYLPTLVVWGSAFVAGPGFAIGTGTSVSPAATSLGVVPGIPVLGIVPESLSPWLLLSVLVVIAVGFMAGWTARARLVRGDAAGRMAPRLAVWGTIAVLGGAAAALLALLASGGIGPDRLAVTGPDAGPLALAVGVELAVGSAVALLTPARAARPTPERAFPAPAGAARPTPERALPAPESALPTPERAFPNPERALPTPERALPTPESAPADPDSETVEIEPLDDLGRPGPHGPAT